MTVYVEHLDDIPVLLPTVFPSYGSWQKILNYSYGRARMFVGKHARLACWVVVLTDCGTWHVSSVVYSASALESEEAMLYLFTQLCAKYESRQVEHNKAREMLRPAYEAQDRALRPLRRGL